MISSSVTGSVVVCPWTTLATESPTSRMSMPARSKSAAIVASYAVSAEMRLPVRFIS
jgi:hypothetical protein